MKIPYIISVLVFCLASFGVNGGILSSMDGPTHCLEASQGISSNSNAKFTCPVVCAKRGLIWTKKFVTRTHQTFGSRCGTAFYQSKSRSICECTEAKYKVN